MLQPGTMRLALHIILPCAVRMQDKFLGVHALGRPGLPWGLPVCMPPTSRA